jgi:hypothetical protein
MNAVNAAVHYSIAMVHSECSDVVDTFFARETRKMRPRRFDSSDSGFDDHRRPREQTPKTRRAETVMRLKGI